jgi:hypothetical protein
MEEQDLNGEQKSNEFIPCVQRLQRAQLSNVEEQEKRQRAFAPQEVLPPLPRTHRTRGNAITTILNYKF